MKKKPTSTPIDHVRAAILTQNNGLPEDQYKTLVRDILNSFCDPERWPMTDANRIALLQKWYRMAQNIQRTENAIAATRPTHE